MPFSCLHLRVARSMSAAFLQVAPIIQQQTGMGHAGEGRVHGSCHKYLRQSLELPLLQPACWSTVGA